MAKSAKQKAVKNKSGSFKKTLLLLIIILSSLAFLPTSTILFVGMLPTISAFFFSINKKSSPVSTIAALNFAGCVPFVFKLWKTGHHFENTFDILTDPLTLVIIYSAAAFGYMLDWVIVGITSTFMMQKSEMRLKTILQRQEKLKEEWGEEVAR